MVHTVEKLVSARLDKLALTDNKPSKMSYKFTTPMVGGVTSTTRQSFTTPGGFNDTRAPLSPYKPMGHNDELSNTLPYQWSANDSNSHSQASRVQNIADQQRQFTLQVRDSTDRQVYT